MARLTAGDPSALGDLFEKHRERLARMVRFRLDRRLAGRLDPDDILQEAFLAAQQRLPHFLKPCVSQGGASSTPESEDRSTSGQESGRPVEFEGKSAFIWLRLIVSQTMVDLHRMHLGAEMRNAARDRALDAPRAGATSACLAAGLAASITSPSGAAVRAELAARLERALARMNPIDQEIIALRHFEDLTNGEVAETLGIGVTAASNRYVRAVARLREIMEAL